MKQFYLLVTAFMLIPIVLTAQNLTIEDQNEINQANQEFVWTSYLNQTPHFGEIDFGTDDAMEDFIPTAGATQTFEPAVGDFFYDTGGPGGGGLNASGGPGTELPGNYLNCNCITTTTLSGVSEIEFHSFEVFGDFDWLKIYDGTDISGTVLYDSNTNSTTDTFTGMVAYNGSGVFTGTSGSITFEFRASGVVDHDGWEVEILAGNGGGGGGENCDLEGELADPLLGGPVWDRPLEGGGGMSGVGVGVSYHVYGPFTVDTAGVYTISSTQTGWDGFIFVYQSNFDPTNPLVNYLAGDDDGPGGVGTSQVMPNLAPGTEYFLITTAFASDDFGPFVNVITGPGTVSCDGGGEEPTEYCGPITFEFSVEPITRVHFAGIDNPSSASTSSPAHEDYTSIEGDVSAGETYEIAVEGFTDGNWEDFITVFIDWNQNGILNDAGEVYEIGSITNSTGTDGIQAVSDIVVPDDATEGQTMMRVFKTYDVPNDSNIDPCALDQNFGQVEDYTLNVTTGGSGGVDCGQGDDSNGFENGYQIGVGTDFENSDDFMVSADNTLNVQTIELNVLAMEPIVSIDFTFRNDAGGSPGATVLPQTITDLVPYDQVLVGSAFGYNVYSVYVDVDLDFTGGATGTTYWMQPQATAAGGIIGGVFWEISSVGTLGAPIHTSELGGPWEADPDGFDGVFKLHCEDVDPPTPPCNYAVTFDIEPITRVVVADIDNPSDAAVNGSPALEDFTAIEGHMTQGESYDVAFEGNTAGNFVNFFTVFVDWNQDGDWIDDGEMYEIGSIANSTGTDGQQATGNISVPADALDGTTVMRVIKNYNVSPTNPCGSYSFGQAEDYTIIVGDGPSDVDCNQGDDSNAFENGYQIGIGTDFRNADDFNVSAGNTLIIQAIEINVISMGGPIDSIDFLFYNDDGGSPGTTTVESATGLVPFSQEIIGTAFGFDVYRIITDVELTFAGGATGTTYWMHPTATAAGGATGGLFWEITSLGTLGSPIHTSEAGGPWNADPDSFDAVFKLHCEDLGASDVTAYDFTYYPNPVKDELNISSQKQIESVSVYNLAGQQVISQKMNVNQGKLSTNSLAPGVYVFRVILDGGMVETFKIIKK
ncbi:MAG: GEVED domain-containing protein [Moheibacter sp.]